MLSYIDNTFYLPRIILRLYGFICETASSNPGDLKLAMQKVTLSSGSFCSCLPKAEIIGKKSTVLSRA